MGPGRRAGGARGRPGAPAGSWQDGLAGPVSRPGSPSPRQHQTLRPLYTRCGDAFPGTPPTAGAAANFKAYSPLPRASRQPPGLREGALGPWLYAPGVGGEAWRVDR